jgi:hypothetical protein
MKKKNILKKKKLLLFLLLFLASITYSQNVSKNKENVKYVYKTDKPFLLYDASKKNLDYLKVFKAENENKSLLIFYMLSKDSIKIVSGGKFLKEDRFPVNSTSVRSIQPISNQKSLELIFFKSTGEEKITITADDLKKYKFIYVSSREYPLQIEFTNTWRMFI